MSKAPDSPPRSRTRSRTRSRSRSYSRSHSRSRSRSRSRKRRYSSRSRSRSRSHSPHRNYPSRDYQNNRGNYRGYNRGYRRPFQYRGRNRGYYPRGRYQNRGGNNYGYRANNWQDDGGGGGGGRGGGRGGGGGGGGGGGWHDQDHHHHHHPPQPHSPRRGRSRTPRKRSGSRSRSRYSDRSSSGHSRHSRRSSYSSRSRSPSPRHRKGGTKGKPGAKEPKEKAGDGPPEAREKSQERPDGSSIEKVAGGKWIDYDTSPKAAGAKEDAGGSGSKGPLWRTVGDDPPPKDTSKSPPRAGQTATFGGFGFFSKEDPKAGDKTGITSAFKKFLAETKSADKDLDRQERDPEKSSSSSKAGSAYSLPASGASFREAKEEKVLPFFAAGEEEFLKAHGMKDSGEGLAGGSGGGAKPQSALSTREMFGKWEEETGYPTSYPLPAKEKSRREAAAAAAAAAAAGGEAEPEESVYRSRKHKKEEKAKKKEKKEKEREKNRRSPSPMPLPPPLHRGSKSQERDRPLFPAAMAARDGSPASRMSITRADFEQKMSAMDEMPGTSLPIERRASRELAAAAAIAPPKKDSEFRSVFNQMQLAQLRQSPSDLFAQHIVTIVHYIKAQHFRSSDMSLSERFAVYQRKAAEVEMMKPRKSPEIHRRIDLSPSAFKRHSHLFEDVEETSYKDPSKKVKGDVMDLRLDIERRKRFAGKESKRDGAKSSGGSRGPSRERSSEKAGKHHKKSKKSKKKRDRSPSSSSSSSSPSPYPPPFRGKDYGGEPPGAPGDHMEEGYGHGRYPPRDYAGPMDRGPRDYEGHNMDRGRGRGFFPRVRGRGWNRGGYPGNNNNNNSSNGNPANNMNPPVRPPDEEWDPEYTPKSRKYYLHDDRDGEKGWVDTRGRGRGGPFPARRGRFVYRKGGASPKWTHDMFQGGEEGELADDTMELEHKESKAEPAAPK
ncbi:thyroid hormone receptor-associated protein 3b isoform X2 [Gadus morhua]|uniref:Thyroid hormone receptor associated protein 3b n=2 Tax=Gadus morhua TaxID=8049 RepID=A0A8C5C4Z7_GADMO|nr:thyroid hormone receptor-associated protein 3 isoform X2 [Gadus morhua]XP_030203649.1 thyroid hormone receptor-associated protein 3 isoform X2 [Gadus morhua]